MSTPCGTICWNADDVYLALIGGCLIGIATSIHYLLMGRVTGFSGIYYSLITFDKGSWNWKLGLMSSVMLASSIMFKIYDNGTTPLLSGASPSYNSQSLLTGIGWAGSCLSGFFVGFGTKMGNGCTSGHGVCGLPRLSIRSFVAVCTFMGMGFITATFRYWVINTDYYGPIMFHQSNAYSIISTVFLCVSCCLIALAFLLQYFQDSSKILDVSVASLTGFIFGLGLVVSGMVQRYKIVSFLTISSIWDPSLAFVMITAVGVNFITFRLLEKPVYNTKYEVPSNKTVDLKLILGAAIFGLGWGIGGLCPGPAFALYPEFTVQIGVLFMVFLGIGQITANVVVEKTKDVEIMSKPLL